MKRLFQATDIFFLPSQMEGISLAIYEAMACGVAIVGADVGGQKELVTSDCGMLIQRSSETIETENYASVLSALLQDSAKLRAIGAAGRRRVAAHFQLAQMGRRMQDLLIRAADLNHSRPRPTVNAGVAHSCLSMAVDYLRIEKLLQSVWPIYSWTEQNRNHLDLMFPSNKVPPTRTLTGHPQPARPVDMSSPAGVQLLEEGIYNFFAYLPERVLQTYLGAGAAHRGPLLGDLLAMRQRILPQIASWEQEERRVYIYGLGTHTQALLGTLPMLMPLVHGFIDKKGEGSFLGLPCVKPEAIGPDRADAIIYSSKRWEKDMYQNLAHLTSVQHVLIYNNVPAKQTSPLISGILATSGSQITHI
jgi:hypothetical protein